MNSRGWSRSLVERPEIPLAVLLLVAILGGWELIIRVFDVPAILVPAPSAVAKSLWTGLLQTDMPWHFLVTAYETLAGFVCGALFGLALGGLIAQFPLLEKTLYPYVVAFQTIPKVAIAPLIVIWFGYGVASKIIITATIAFFPVLANTIVGLRSAPQEQVDLMIAFTASRWQIFWRVKVPQALPYIFVGLDVGIVLSIIGAIVGEFVGAQAGLGYLILQRNFSMDMGGVFAILVILSLMGMGLHAVMQAIQKRVVFWADAANDRITGA